MKRTFQIDSSPATHVLDSLMHTKIHWPEAFSELVDNSLDQGATKVTIETFEQGVAVIDNGAGCNDLSAMLRLGSHRNTATTKLGRYGVGLKNVALGLGDRLDIESTTGGVMRSASVHWPSLRDSGCWSRIDGEEVDVKTATGTRVQISQFHGPSPYRLKCMNAIGFTFAPALLKGVKIAWVEDGVALAIEPWRTPKMSNVIECFDEREDGIGFTLRAGIVGSTERGPFVISYQHRIIGTTSEPCKRLYPSKKFLGIVELHGKWPLLKHKDGLKDSEESNWLYESLHAICSPLLTQLHKEGDAVELNEIAAELEGAFAAITGKATRRSIRVDNEAIDPKGTQNHMKKYVIQISEQTHKKLRIKAAEMQIKLNVAANAAIEQWLVGKQKQKGLK
jgi:hypothetical protein